MSYPESKASYRHQPKFLDRALAEEKRADGGAINDDPYAALKPMQQTDRGPLLEHNQYADRYRSVDDIVKEGSDPSASSRFTSSSGRNPDDGRKRGGTVKRADGGSVLDDDDDDDMDLTAGTEVDDVDDVAPEPAPRRRRKTQTREED